MDIKDFSLQNKNLSSKVSIWTGSPGGLLADPRAQFTPDRAQAEGTSVSRIKRTPELKAWLFVRVAAMVRRVDAAKTLSRQDEIEDCVETIIEMCPTLTIEECELVFRDIERGRIKLYNRLKIPEVIDALIQYDVDTATPIRERRHRPDYDRDAPRMSAARQEFLSLSESDILTLAHGTETKNTRDSESGS
jgi:hypothetical protein